MWSIHRSYITGNTDKICCLWTQLCSLHSESSILTLPTDYACFQNASPFTVCYQTSDAGFRGEFRWNVSSARSSLTELLTVTQLWTWTLDLFKMVLTLTPVYPGGWIRSRWGCTHRMLAVSSFLHSSSITWSNRKVFIQLLSLDYPLVEWNAFLCTYWLTLARSRSSSFPRCFGLSRSGTDAVTSVTNSSSFS